MQSLDQIWESVLSILQEKSTRSVYDLWFKDLRLVYLDGDKAAVVINSDLKKDIIQKRYAQPLTEALCEVIGFDPPITVLSDEQEKIDPQKIFEEKKSSEPEKEVFSALEEKESLNDPSPILTNDEYTFDNFIVGSSNKLAYAACTAIAKNSSSSFNPLFIYGGAGLGKTHIMHAIANYIKQNNPLKTVLYATCEKFTSDLITTIRQGKAYSQEGMNFRNKYRNVDVLIIDDVQFLAKKQSTQEEFFHTFNELYSQNKQIVLSADCHPKEIELLSDRLKTRFEGGLMAQVLPPDIETKIAILQKKAELRKYILSLDVALYLAEISDNDVRSLEGMLNKVIFASMLHEEPITLELAKEALNESAPSDGEKEVLTTDSIIDAVCNFYKIQRSDLLGKKKTKEVVEPRQICAYLMTELLSIPLVTIGQALGGRDHTTVIHARDKISELIKENTRVNTEIKDLKNMILKK